MPDEISRGTPWTILIVDDHPLLRHGIVQLLDMEQDLKVVGEAESVEHALRLLESERIDMALVDITLEGGSGIDLLKAIHVRHPQTRTLVVSMHDELLYAERALRVGARGYLMKHEAPKRVVAAIREVLAGNIVLSETMRSRLLERLIQTPGDAPGSPLQVLSDRELEIFRMIGQGLKKGEIARGIQRSVHTVEAHRASIKRKLGFKNATELARAAYHALNDQE